MVGHPKTTTNKNIYKIKDIMNNCHLEQLVKGWESLTAQTEKTLTDILGKKLS